MGDVSIAPALEKFFELVGNTERNDFDFFTAGADDVVMMVMEVAVFFVPVKAFTQINHIENSRFTKSFQRTKEGGPVIFHLLKSPADFFGGNGSILMIEKFQNGEAQRSTFKSLAAKQCF